MRRSGQTKVSELNLLKMTSVGVRSHSVVLCDSCQHSLGQVFLGSCGAFWAGLMIQRDYVAASCGKVWAIKLAVICIFFMLFLHVVARNMDNVLLLLSY